MIWGSILGVAPFTLILPYASLHWTGVLTVIIGFIPLRHFLAILCLCPGAASGRIGMVSGLFSVLLSAWEVWGRQFWGIYRRPHQRIELVYKICAFPPLIGDVDHIPA